MKVKKHRGEYSLSLSQQEVNYIIEGLQDVRQRRKDNNYSKENEEEWRHVKEMIIQLYEAH